VLRSITRHNICSEKPDASTQISAHFLTTRELQRSVRTNSIAPLFKTVPGNVVSEKERSLNETQSKPCKDPPLPDALHHLGFTCMLHQMPVLPQAKQRTKYAKCKYTSNRTENNL
jgi:hypothetical protein